MLLRNFVFCILALFLLPNAQAQQCNLDFEDWESATNANPPSGWQRIDSYVGSANGSAYGGSKYGGMNTLGDQWVVKPLSCPGEICFWWRSSGLTSNFDVDIDWSIDNGGTWTTAHQISIDGTTDNRMYTQLCVDLPENLYTAPFEGVLIRFHHSRRVGGSFYFDDVCVNGGVCTVAPTQLTFSSLQAGCIADATPFSYTVCATDASGNVDDTYAQSISIAASNLSGTMTQTATNGCVQFTDLAFSTAGNYVINATSSSLTGAAPSLEILDDCPTVETLKVMSYNLLNFPDGRNDCGSNIIVPSRWDTLQKIIEEVQPDVLMVCELQTEAGADMILSNALNVNGTSHYARAAFVPNQSPGGTVLNNCFFYNTAKMTLYSQDEVATNVRDIGEYIVYMNDPNLASHNDTTFIDFYDAHLKAGEAQSNVDSRAVQCQALQNHITAKGAARNALVGGDFNFYDSAEAGYQALLSGSYPFNDPVDTPGAWNNDAAFMSVHSQSTRMSGTTPLECGATGGMDSRFDFLMASDNVMNGTDGVQFTANSYVTLGNSGNLFNDAINDAANTSGVPKSVLDALHNMSDHLPIILDLDITYPLVALPIELMSFDAFAKNNEGHLAWRILDEAQDLSHCIIEKSVDGRNFKTLGQLARQANTDYEFIDYILNKGVNYYRLKMVHWNGAELYSQVVSVAQEGLAISVYPNPVSDKLHIDIEGNDIDLSDLEVNVFDRFGKLIATQTGISLISTSSWSSGLNLVQIRFGQQVEMVRVVKE